MGSHPNRFLLVVLLLLLQVSIPTNAQPQEEEEELEKVVIDLFEKVATTDVTIREKYAAKAEEELVSMGGKVVPILLEHYLMTDSARERHSLNRVVSKIGEPALEHLHRVMWEGDPEKVRRISYILGRIASPRSTHILLEYVDKPGYEEARSSIVYALGRIGSKEAVPKLIALINDQDVFLRKNVVVALGRIGDPRAVQSLVQSLGDKYHIVRYPASEALTKIGEPAVPKLLEELEKSSGKKKYHIIETLGKIGSLEAVPSLAKVLDDKDWAARAFAAEALAELGAKQVLGKLWVLAKTDEHPYVRQAATQAIQKIEETDS